MLTNGVILIAAFLYLGILFAIAYYADKRADQGRSIISNPYIYTLSIAVYCTAWTFYGSVGRASSTGLGFLPIYLGPTLMAALWWMVLRKIIRIVQAHRITSIADFISSRYGKSTLLGGIVTIIAVIGIMPYISLQLKAVSASVDVITHFSSGATRAAPGANSIWTDTALYIALLLAAFTILFGTRQIDVSERHEGMVAAIAFESVVKLVAFLCVGMFVTFGLFDGPGDLFGQAMAVPRLAGLMTMEGSPGGYTSWFTLTFLAMMAIMFLPRQFQVAVVENVNADHLRKASWLFPLYLLVINLFVLPIALGGNLLFPNGQVDPDTYVLTLPMSQHADTLALFVFIGGLSAATSMVIVATITLSTMVCNDLVMPVLLRIRSLQLAQRRDLTRLLLGIRRGAIVLILLLGYSYYHLIGESYTLVTIGLVSFAAAAQFAPPILFGIYWNRASRSGAMSGLLAGFFIWGYTLLLPGFARSGWLSTSFLSQGPFGIDLLRPYQLFGMQGLDHISHAVFWSMLANIGLLVVVSLFSRRSPIEQVQATLFTREDHDHSGDAYSWAGTTTEEELKGLANRFLGEAKTRELFNLFNTRETKQNQATRQTRLINHVERYLAGAIGAASARVMISSIVKGEALSLHGVMQILEETTQVREYSHALEQKSQELEAASSKLKAANERLQELDRLKDEFVSTVSHELRTPLTSIRSFSEILHANLELPESQREEYLAIIIGETERLTRLINDVLDLAKIESGRVEWNRVPFNLGRLVQDASNTVSQLFQEKQIQLDIQLPAQDIIAIVDRDRIQQVVINLLSNAAKFCDETDGLVTIELTRIERVARITVSDNGMGIPAGELEPIFEKFHQVEEQDSATRQGTGLGLAICRGIVEHHHGHLWAENMAGKGSRFICELPCNSS
ncbi:MAG: histidine kinase [Gammaproteobacteria bacterium]|nr:histidine kinase [Gammaproteobacteria bacterium]